MFNVDELKVGFKNIFGSEPFLIRAPGRVNLTGEHTDYNDGFIMPAALEYETRAAVAPRSDRILRVHSAKIGETREFDLDDPAPQPKRDWTDYVFGVAVALAGAGKKLKGADILVAVVSRSASADAPAWGLFVSASHDAAVHRLVQPASSNPS